MTLQTKNGNEWNGTVGSSDKLHVSNILDPIHDTLDQRVFKGTDPRPQKASFIYNHFMDAVRELVPTPEGYFDLYLTGSLTTYQYSNNSDCDISIFPHYDQLIEAMGFPDANQIRRALVTFVIDKVDGVILPGTTHPIQNFVVADGVSLTQMYHQGLRSAWSFQDHQWVVPPEQGRAHDVSIELPLMFLRARAMADKMRIALDTDPELAKRLFHRIHTKRSQDQIKGYGDFSESNIIYKYLLNQGLFDRLKDIGVYIAKISTDQPMQVIYDFQADHIILGDKEAATNLPNTIIVGTYDQGHVTLNQHAHQWLNTAYFKKLWANSFPSYPLNALSIMHEFGPKRLATIDWRNIEYQQAFMYAGNPYNKLVINGGSMHYELITDFMQINHIEDEKELEQIPFVLGHIGIINDGETALEDAPHVIVFDSHQMAYLKTDPIVKTKALAAIRQRYPNTTDITGRVPNNWWKGGGVLPEQLTLNFPAEQLILDLDKPFIEIPQEPKERGQIVYADAFMYLGRPEYRLMIGGQEHSDLIEGWIQEETIDMIDNGMHPDDAETEAWQRFESTPQVFGHIGTERSPESVLNKVAEWAVFYSGARELRRDQPLKNEALQEIRQKTEYKNIKEGDNYVYEVQWYGYGD